jgi:serine phosphatase RsbU (regulator of sigma subunit)
VGATPAGELFAAMVQGQTPEEIIEGILERAAAFEGGQPQFDDMTLMVMRLQETACA